MRDSDIITVDEDGTEHHFVHLRAQTTRLGFECSGDQRHYDWWQRGHGDFSAGTRYRQSITMAMVEAGHSRPTWEGYWEDARPKMPDHILRGARTGYVDTLDKARRLYVEHFYGSEAFYARFD